MTRVRRRSRAVYRVYDEEEYLAGADRLSDRENMPPAGEPAHGHRRLQRIAGAAALTGAVGTVGGVMGLAGLRTHTLARRELAQQRIAPSARVASRGHVRVSEHVRRRQIAHTSSPRRARGRGSASVRVSSSGHAWRAEMAERTASRVAAGAPPIANARRAEIDESSDPSASKRPAAQGEFGFER